jgi:hypothetical protein
MACFNRFWNAQRLDREMAIAEVAQWRVLKSSTETWNKRTKPSSTDWAVACERRRCHMTRQYGLIKWAPAVQWVHPRVIGVSAGRLYGFRLCCELGDAAVCGGVGHGDRGDLHAQTSGRTITRTGERNGICCTPHAPHHPPLTVHAVAHGEKLHDAQSPHPPMPACRRARSRPRRLIEICEALLELRGCYGQVDNQKLVIFRGDLGGVRRLSPDRLRRSSSCVCCSFTGSGKTVRGSSSSV